jgi:ribosomal protein S12 methylthiotransferase
MSKKVSINLITLGCAKNSVDSEFLLGSLNQNLFKIRHINHVEPCDYLMINTCGFINDAKQESINVVLEGVKIKKQGLVKILIVFGCLTERYREELKKEIPEVDYFFGVNDKEKIKKILYCGIRNIENLNETRLLSTPKHYAYLKISEGCNRTCSFCAIPLIRGKYFSRSIESLKLEAENLASQGVKELILIAQDLTFYGYDIYKKPSLLLLINTLSEINGIKWIRLHYLYPRFITNELIKAIAENHKVCKYIDIPIQHISDKMLSVMRRGVDKEATKALLYKIRAKIPGIAFRTTLLVGHPNETQKDFKELCEFIQEFRFDRLGVFPYSHEEGTYSYKNFKNSIPKKVIDQRVAKIMSIQQEISLERNYSKVGSVQEILIDRKENDILIARTQYDSPEIDNEVILNESNLKIGEFYKVRITEATEFDLIAESF